jgi:GxxExxY protein
MDEEINALTRRIIGLAMRAHTRLGPGLLEQAYKRCLGHEFDRAGIPYQCKIDVALDNDGARLDCSYRANVIVANRVILELKSVEHNSPLREAQLATYVWLSFCRIGLLLNLNAAALKDGIRRRIA